MSPAAPRSLRLLACTALAAAFLSCSSSSTPSLVALERQRVLELSRRAAGDPPAQDAPLAVRWNPAPCDCPPFEVQVDGEWLRAEVKPTTPEAEAVLAPYVAHPEAPAWQWSAAGRVKPDKAVKSGMGQAALSVEVRWLGQGEAPALVP